ncbi:PEP/pyruvate-binding domain-containing protein [Streptomyces sp. NPDC004232]|uniref:PEP/pyruvate-binding domain-containing protein n=1 Tax=Streptomyces sp. NPDC004232 TaxID=3154454 RepID=UPI0033B86C9F
MASLIPLARLGLDDTDRVGRKAAVLGEAVRAGFRVPDGFAVPWQVLAEVLGGAADDPTVATERIRTAPLWPELRADLAAALAALGDVPVAVRSSGVEEDLAGRSFAGQYDSVLGVVGADAVAQALRQCWASAFSDHLNAYRDGAAVPPRIGVLVQVMVPAAEAGAAFSANPVTGDRDEALVSAVSGLGDRLMAGESTADEWSVRDGAARLVRGTGEAITAAQACEVARLANQATERFGTPQDVEWAYVCGELWLLQARPITTLVDSEPLPGPVEVPPGFHARDVRSPAPRVRLESSVYLPMLSASARHLFAFTSGAALTATDIGGWVYLTPEPEDVRNAERIAEQVADGTPLALVERWESEWKPAYVARIRQFRERDLGAMEDSALAAHTKEVTGFFAELHNVYFQVAGASMFLSAELGLLAQRLADWPPGDVLPLRGGLAGEHMGAVVALGDLARLATTEPALRAELERDTPAAVGRLAALAPRFAAAFEAYLAEHGHRSPGFDLTEPTFAERPAAVLAMVTAQLDDPFEPETRRAALARRVRPLRSELESRLADRTVGERQHFEAALAAAERSSPIRDEKSHLAVSVWALLRYAVLEIGVRLAAAGRIDRREDVFHVPLDQVLAALGEPTDLHEEVRLGRARHLWAQTHPGLRIHGTPTALPVTEPKQTELSAQARHVRDVAAWAARLMQQTPETPETYGLSGLAASAGRTTGPVRIISSPSNFVRLRPGEVLVCPETTAQWAMLFPSLKGLVTDGGSLLSHPAILAREYGIPAVVATGDATTVLRDGDLVEVDGTAGTVRLLGASVAARRAERSHGCPRATPPHSTRIATGPTQEKPKEAGTAGRHDRADLEG